VSRDPSTADTTGDDIPKEQREAIVKLGEEAGEFIQAMCKTLNFGYVAKCEGKTWLNLSKMESECADILATKWVALTDWRA
jgi:NTP pyrophosphatase (non-canonical NTP hydrolase)